MHDSSSIPSLDFFASHFLTDVASLAGNGLKLNESQGISTVGSCNRSLIFGELNDITISYWARFQGCVSATCGIVYSKRTELGLEDGLLILLNSNGKPLVQYAPVNATIFGGNMVRPNCNSFFFDSSLTLSFSNFPSLLLCFGVQDRGVFILGS